MSCFGRAFAQIWISSCCKAVRRWGYGEWKTPQGWAQRLPRLCCKKCRHVSTHSFIGDEEFTNLSSPQTKHRRQKENDAVELAQGTNQTIAELAETLGKHRNTIRRWMHNGKLAPLLRRRSDLATRTIQ